MSATHIWPFPNIPPELFETLSSDDKRLLEAIAQLVLAEYRTRRQRPPIADD